MKVVVDTNVLVSGLLSTHSPPALIVQAIETGHIEPVFCETMLREYLDVLMRPRFRLEPETVAALLEQFAMTGTYIDPAAPLANLHFPDDSDTPFYLTALAANCVLVTGNRKHFPGEGAVEVLSPRELVTRL